MSRHYGQGIRNARENVLLSQRELARMANVSQAMISRIETNGDKVTKAKLAEIQGALLKAAETLPERRREIERKALAKLSQLERRVLGLFP